MKTYNSDANVVDCTAPVGGVVSGMGYQIGDRLVVALADAAVGETFAGLTRGVVRLPKTNPGAGTGAAEGVGVYWTTAASEVSALSAGGILIGCFNTVAADGDASAEVYLDGAIR